MNNKTLFCCIACLSGGLAYAQAPMFEEVAIPSGIDYTGQSWGGSWGDFDGDGWYDLWTSNHGNPASLFLNGQDGTFSNISQAVLPEAVWDYFFTAVGSYDSHGALWFDADGDGDADLLQGASGADRMQPNHLYINNGGVNFSAEIAAPSGVDGTDRPSRMPLALDWNRDGLPDLFLSHGDGVNSPSFLSLYESVPSGGDPQWQDVHLQLQPHLDQATTVGLLADLDADGDSEILTGPAPNFVKAFEFQSGSAVDVTSELGLFGVNGSTDALVGDFDGDLDMDLFAVRGEATSDLVQTAADSLEAALAPSGDEKGFSFATSGDVSIGLHPDFSIAIETIFIGLTGYQPASNEFSLSPSDPANFGMPDYQPGIDKGYYLGYEVLTQRWTLISSSPTFGSTNVTVSSSSDITDPQTTGFTAGTGAREDLYYRNDGLLVSSAATAGFTGSSSARSVAAADFDNDGDLDIFAAATGPVENLPNVLYLNDGSGVFSVAPPGHGAEGGSEGRADGAALADMDNDGDIDIFVANGKSKSPFDEDGRYYLFRNLGNNNHWIQFELEGTDSNRQGLGAMVTLTAGGKSQLRLRGNAVNARDQHMARIHFGLGAATAVDAVEIQWPSGTVQTVTNLAADQILTITEPPSSTDFDNDGIIDTADNCLEAENPDQTDTDADGYGNACDADFNNNCVINFSDLGLIKSAMFGTDLLYDLNGNGVVNFSDLAIVKSAFLGPPGPSGTTNTCGA